MEATECIEANAPAALKMGLEMLRAQIEDGEMQGAADTARDLEAQLKIWIEWFRALNSAGIRLPKDLAWTRWRWLREMT